MPGRPSTDAVRCCCGAGPAGGGAGPVPRSVAGREAGPRSARVSRRGSPCARSRLSPGRRSHHRRERGLTSRFRRAAVAVALPRSSACGSFSAVAASTASSTRPLSGRGSADQTLAHRRARSSSWPLPAAGRPRRPSQAVTAAAGVPAPCSAAVARSRSSSARCCAVSLAPRRSRTGVMMRRARAAYGGCQSHFRNSPRPCLSMLALAGRSARGGTLGVPAAE